DRLSIGKLVERSVPALVVPRGQMKTNLLGMSFLDRLESWEVRADRLVLRGFPEPITSRGDRSWHALQLAQWHPAAPRRPRRASRHRHAQGALSLPRGYRSRH